MLAVFVALSAVIVVLVLIIGQLNSENRSLRIQNDQLLESTLKRPCLNVWALRIHAWACGKGWWPQNKHERNKYELIALMHTELSEAVEELRNHRDAFYVIKGKPEGWATELVDCIIRILDVLGAEGIDVDCILRMKHEYNSTRPYRHGGKQA